MKIRTGLIVLIAALAWSGMTSASTIRVIIVETSDVAAYTKSVLTEGQALMKKKGSQGQIRIWQATFAGDDAGTVGVIIEYPNLEALAKDTALFSSDAELRAWLGTLGKLRKIRSDGIWEELKP